jgi:hypothetical protein
MPALLLDKYVKCNVDRTISLEVLPSFQHSESSIRDMAAAYNFGFLQILLRFERHSHLFGNYKLFSISKMATDVRR